ncbi:MAG: hypothetical protein WBZ33_14680, partial [Thermoactinomyces sp.]
KMPYTNNISKFKIDRIAHATRVNFGNSANVRQLALRRFIGVSFFIGDRNLFGKGAKNFYFDPDDIDYFYFRNWIRKGGR